MHSDKIYAGFCGNIRDAKKENMRKEQIIAGKRAFLRKIAILTKR